MFCINCKTRVNTYADYNEDYCSKCDSDNLLHIVDDTITVNQQTAIEIFDDEKLNLYNFFKNSNAFTGPEKDICRYNIKTEKFIFKNK